MLKDTLAKQSINQDVSLENIEEQQGFQIESITGESDLPLENTEVCIRAGFSGRVYWMKTGKQKRRF